MFRFLNKNNLLRKEVPKYVTYCTTNTQVYSSELDKSIFKLQKNVQLINQNMNDLNKDLDDALMRIDLQFINEYEKQRKILEVEEIFSKLKIKVEYNS